MQVMLQTNKCIIHTNNEQRTRRSSKKMWWSKLAENIWRHWWMLKSVRYTGKKAIDEKAPIAFLTVTFFVVQRRLSREAKHIFVCARITSFSIVTIIFEIVLLWCFKILKQVNIVAQIESNLATWLHIKSKDVFTWSLGGPLEKWSLLGVHYYLKLASVR